MRGNLFDSLPLLTSAVVILLASCSVKEARGPCPCWLQLDLGACREGEVFVSVWNPEMLLSDYYEVSQGHELYEHSIPKGLSVCSVLKGAVNSELTGHDLLTRSGFQADSIYASASDIYAEGEFVSHSALLHKQFATVCLSISRDETGNIPYELKVNSNIAGIDVRNMEPVYGEFDYRPVPSESGEYCFRILRQKDNSLTVGLIRDGVAMGDLPLGEYIARSGYDWSDVDLKDIYIGIDFIRSEMHVSVGDWENGENYDLIVW